MTYEQWKKQYDQASEAYWSLGRSFDYKLDDTATAQVRLNTDGFALMVYQENGGYPADFGRLSLRAMTALAQVHFLATRYVRGELAEMPDPVEWNAGSI